jgi:hypothetical protein
MVWSELVSTLWLAVFFIMGEYILACGLLPAEVEHMVTEAGHVSKCAFW